MSGAAARAPVPALRTAQPEAALRVTDFGADPEPTGDDAAAVQRAFDAAAERGMDVYLPPGHYRVSRTVSFRASGRAVFGAPAGKSILAGDTTRYSLLELQSTRNSTVRDLRFEGSRLNDDKANTEKAIVCNGTFGTVIRRVHSYGTGYIVFDNGGTNTTLEDSVCEDYGRIGYLIGTGGTVRRCRFTNQDGWRFSSEMQGVYASAGKKNITIEDNEFTNCGIYAIQLWGSQSGVWTENITIQRNTFTQCPRVLVVAAGDSGPSYRNVRFLGNTIRRTGEKSIHIGKYNGSTANDSQLLIDGNVFEDAGPAFGILITPWGGDAPVSGIRIANNRFLAPNRSSYNGMVHVAGGGDVVIEANRFQDLGRDGDGEIVSSGVYLKAGKGLVLRRNNFSHWPGAGTARDVAAITLEPAVRDATIRENEVRGSGRPRCYGVRVTAGAGPETGAVTGNVFRGAKLGFSGVPASGNEVR
jgi:polygalacturonase